MRKTIYTLALATLVVLSAKAQSPEELLMFSRQNFGISTARSSAMAGAFTALGDDAIAMSLNPAGLAMYSSSEISISPGLRISNTYPMYGSTVHSMGNYTKPTVGNFSAVYANGNGWVWGIAMNRLADFSGNYSVTGDWSENSMAYIFRDQLQGSTLGSLVGNKAFDRPPGQWNALMGLNTWLVNPEFDNIFNKDYHLDGIINSGDQVVSQLSSTTNGTVDEIAMSGAYSWGNILYFGATFGMQSLTYRQNTLYTEYADVEYNTGDLDQFSIRDNLSLDGFGLNLKLGLTLRPLSWLRIGVAYHSPTWIVMNEFSVRDMETYLISNQNSNEYSDYTPDFRQNYSYQTPSRLMAGLSVTIAKRVILSADYERTWYNGMRYSTRINESGWRAPITPSDVDNNPRIIGDKYVDRAGNINMNAMIRNNYRATNNFRAGIEAQPARNFFLRAGYAYSESPYAPIESTYAAGTKLSSYGAIHQYSGGIGFGNRNFKVDLSYIYSAQNTLPTVFYDYIATSDYNDIRKGDNLIPSDNIYKSLIHHNIILTIAWKF